jgi:hypothetical protein
VQTGNRAGRRWILGLSIAAAAAAACLTSTSNRLREALVGLPGRELRQCLGSPLDVSEQDGTEVARYRWAEQVERPSAFGGAERIDTLTRDKVRDWPVDGRSEEDRKKLGRRGRLGFCELRFALRDGTVQAVESEARSTVGINLDAECLLRARDCVPREKLFP